MRWVAAALFVGGVFGAGGAAAEVTALEVPSVAVTRMGEPLTLSSAGFDAPRPVGELEAGETLRIEIDGGAITLAGTDGLALVEGDGAGDASVRFSGSADAIEAALDGLVVEPPAGFAGALNVRLAVEPGGIEAGFRVAVHAPIDGDQLRDTLLAGVVEIHSGVQPGQAIAYGLEAYDVVWYPEGAGAGPMVVAASWGAGRVIAMPDHQMLNMDAYGDVAGTFYQNGIAWLTGRDDRSAAIVTLSASVGAWLALQGYDDVRVTDPAGLAAALEGAEVLIPPWLGADEPAANIEAIGRFVRAGGGLFLAEYGVGYVWWWGPEIYEAPGNALLREAGIGFASGNRWEVGTLDATRRASGQVNAETLLALLDDPAPFDAATRDRAGLLFQRISDVLPPDDPLRRRIDAGYLQRVGAVAPTPAAPVSSEWDKALLLRALADIEATPLDEMVAHPSADAVFGPVPAEAPRVERVVRIDPSVTRWHGTGLYAAPGEIVEVDVPAEAVGRGFRVRISGHTDDISVRPSWLRMPRVARAFPVDAGTVRAGGAFGGAIYFDVGTDARALEPFEITIRGGVAAPHFVLGEMDDADWLAAQRDNPAPFAEFESPRLAISLPSSMIRDLENPTALMTFWDEVVALQDALGTHAALRTNAERINIDVQVSVGYLHAGYPTQGPTVSGPEIVDLARLRHGGSWGWFHELGHEAQRRPDKSWPWNNAYTFDGSVECTVNLFTSYAYDELGIPTRGGWSWTGGRVDVMRRALGATAGGTYASVGVGDKLAMHLQLRDHFGWIAYRDALTLYNADALDALPQADPDKRDLFLVRMSEAVGHDLGPFFVDVWGLEVTAESRAAVAVLPEWMPALGGIEGRFESTPGTPLVFDLAGEALAHDGVADLGGVTEPEHGTLEDDGFGRFTYTPDPGFEGTDAFEYTVVSSTGHAVVSRIEIGVTTTGVLAETWFGVPGVTLADLTGDARYPDQPDERTVLGTFDAPQDRADNYGVRLRGFLRPAVTGDYTFLLASDDAGGLWVSSDFRAENAVEVAGVPAWSSYREWDRFASQASDPIPLQAGRVYYIEALMKEGGGGDHLSVGWIPPGAETVELLPREQLRVWEPGFEPPVELLPAAELAPDDTCGPSPMSLTWAPCAGDGAASAAVWIDGAAVAEELPPAADSWAPDGLAEGEHSWFVRCADADGRAVDSARARFTADDSAPTVGSVAFEGGAVVLTVEDGEGCGVESVALTFNDAAPRAAMLVDGVHRAGAPALGVGRHALVIDVTDAAGNTDSLALTVDVGGCAGDGDCDLGAGACRVAEPEGSSCDDGDACTEDDVCAEGACVGVARICDDGLDCTVDRCDPETGACGAEPALACCADADCGAGGACADGACFDVTCEACEDDEACGVDGVCADTEDGAACFTACDADGVCPDGSVCADDLGLCVPEDGACEPMDPEDGGVPTADVGVGPEDGGAPDGGPSEGDAGMEPALDAATEPGPEPDAAVGPAVDAGTEPGDGEDAGGEGPEADADQGDEGDGREDAGAATEGSGGSSGCAAAPGGPGAPVTLLLVGLLLVRRRRTQAARAAGPSSRAAAAGAGARPTRRMR
jgi:MYXO-CTERM domain-containing protein